MYELALRVTIEALSAVACFILVTFMIKPYQVTGEGRYIGLPLAFVFLGVSYLISAVTFVGSEHFDLAWRFQLIFRLFAFVFLAAAYYFSKKPSRNSRVLWNIVFGGLLVILAVSILLTFIGHPPVLGAKSLDFIVRLSSLVCIGYVFIHCLWKGTITRDPHARWVLVAYGLLGLSQYSVIVWVVDRSFFAFWGSLVFRLVSLALLLAIAYRIFYVGKKGVKDEDPKKR